MKQDIMEHSLKQKKLGNTTMRYKKMLTHRAIARFLEAIDAKLNDLIKQKTKEQLKEEYSDEEFNQAM